nr:hypothetical protein [Tanacetum cinerariifolium]
FDFTQAFTELIKSNEMALVLTTLFLLCKLGCDPLALVSKFTPVEERTGLLETTFVKDIVLMGVFSDEGICSVNLIFLLLFTEVTAISLVPKSLMQGQYKFSLPVKVFATARRLEMPQPEVCTAIEEKKKKLPVKDRWQLH